MKIITTKKYAQYGQRYVHVEPSGDKEGLYNVVITSSSNINLGGQVYKENIPHKMALHVAKKLVEEFGYELIEQTESGRQRYDKWLSQSKIAQRNVGEKINTRTKMSILKGLIEAGLDGNGRFPESDSGIAIAATVLHDHGFALDMVTKDIFMGDKGSRTISVSKENTTPDPFMPGPEVQNSMLYYSWEQLSPGKFEILAYLT